jgi:hypothetical protein
VVHFVLHGVSPSGNAMEGGGKAFRRGVLPRNCSPTAAVQCCCLPCPSPTTPSLSFALAPSRPQYYAVLLCAAGLFQVLAGVVPYLPWTHVPVLQLSTEAPHVSLVDASAADHHRHHHGVQLSLKSLGLVFLVAQYILFFLPAFSA